MQLFSYQLLAMWHQSLFIPLLLSSILELTSVNIFFTGYRFEENATTKDALYVAEKQEHDQTKQALSNYQEKNWELLKKVDESEKSINKLLENVQRFWSHFHH
jgi:hypothetical protein